MTINEGTLPQEFTLKSAIELQEKIVQGLKLPYRVMNCCTGDLPFPKPPPFMTIKRTKIQRPNSRCSCGSGKKFKKCCMGR